MLRELAIVVGVIVLGMALRSYRSPLTVRLGFACILAATGLAVGFLTDSWAAGVVSALSWFLLPWVEFLTRVRQLRLPMHKTIRHMTPPSRERFPALGGLTEDIEQEGFEFLADLGWESDPFRQFFRVFYRSRDRLLAAICLNEQDGMAFSYISLSSRENVEAAYKEGDTWMTWNFPFSHSMQIPPYLHLNEHRGGEDSEELLASHHQFLLSHRVSAEKLREFDEDSILAAMQNDLVRQMDHNLQSGLLTQAGEGMVRYSWRGLFFLYKQFLLEFVRLR